MSAVGAAAGIIDLAVADRLFPAAAVDVGHENASLWSGTFGRLTFDPASPPTTLTTPFDLASLTKVLATSTLVMELVRRGELSLDDRVSAFFARWRGTERESVTVRDLLEHASGLPARLTRPAPSGRADFEDAICSEPLEYTPRSRSIYSDLGFVLLGFLAADVSGSPLGDAFARLAEDVQAASSSDLVTYHLPPDRARTAAPTRPLPWDPRGEKLLVGEVHDDYAAALGGEAGHAGLFGTAAGVAAWARVLLRAIRGADDQPPPFSRSIARTLVAKSSVPGSSRAIGWDTMLITSSCGTKMSPAAIGHVGFTGTSLWIDPDRDRYFVLLTNRACGGGTLDEMRMVRRSFHDALGEL